MSKSLDIDMWAQIVIKEWLDNLAAMQVYSTFSLQESFQYIVHRNANGDASKIDFMFNFYGKFVEMAVGRGVSFDFSGASSNKRQKKEWYTKTLYSQVYRLRELLAEKFAGDASRTIVASIYEASLKGRAALKTMGGANL